MNINNKFLRASIVVSVASFVVGAFILGRLQVNDTKATQSNRGQCPAGTYESGCLDHFVRPHCESGQFCETPVYDCYEDGNRLGCTIWGYAQCDSGVEGQGCDGTYEGTMQCAQSNQCQATPTPKPTNSPTPKPTGTPNPTSTPVPSASPTDTPRQGDPNSCNGTCGSNYNCQSGLFCYQGYCRNPSCQSETSCGCASPQVLSATAPPVLPKTGSNMPEIVLGFSGLVGIGVYLFKRFRLV